MSEFSLKGSGIKVVKTDLPANYVAFRLIAPKGGSELTVEAPREILSESREELEVFLKESVKEFLSEVDRLDLVEVFYDSMKAKVKGYSDKTIALASIADYNDFVLAVK